MRNTWWVTRPKRYLGSVPRALSALATIAVGTLWSTPDKAVPLAIEANLETSGIKRRGNRRDQSGSGARTYRSWLKSLGLLFMDSAGHMQLTLAGEDLIAGDPPLPILQRQIINFQYPSAWSSVGASAVSPRFKVHPFYVLLRLLKDTRLDGYLTEKEDVAKIIICYGTSDSDTCHEDLVNRILALRNDGDASLDANYATEFRTSRTASNTLSEIFKNHADIANTLRNWLAYAQYITVENGTWRLNPALADDIETILANPPKFIAHHDNEERYQRAYGIGLKRKKDTRNLDNSRTITKALIEESQIEAAFTKIASTQVITNITASIVDQVAQLAGAPTETVERHLRKTYPHGCVNIFVSEYLDMAAQSRERATEFEIATTDILREVFGYNATHIGANGIVPDIYVTSDEEHYGGIFDNKAYKNGYSITNDHYNRMVHNYIPDYQDKDYDLAFFSYIATEYKHTVNKQIARIGEETGVHGSILTALDIINLIEHNQTKPFTHHELRELFSCGRAITKADIENRT